jgi:RNA polymerase sigma-70 factor (ECF subfamily)
LSSQPLDRPADGACAASLVGDASPSPEAVVPDPGCGRADEELLAAAVDDPSALGALYDRHSRLVYGLARAMLSSREEAEDLTHEVFVGLCGPTGYDPGRGSVAAFLVTVTRSRAIDRLRRRVRSARLLESWPEAAPATIPTPCEHASLRRTAQRVRSVLAELPMGQRQVLEMAYYKGLSQHEIAIRLELPLGTVKSRSRRALQSLGRSLEDLTI